jgi:hypothetical protein
LARRPEEKLDPEVLSAMGQLRFLAPRRERVPQGAVERAYMAGIEGAPWRTRCGWSEDHLVVDRANDESGNLYMPWRVEGHGELVLSTASLMDRERAYHLPLELARGTLNRLRNQKAEWELSGLVLPTGLAELLGSAMTLFTRAATSQSDPLAAADLAEQTLRVSLDAIEQLGAAYCRQVIELRHRQQPRLPMFLAGQLDRDSFDDENLAVYLTAFNWAAPTLAWAELEPLDGQPAWDAADQQIRWCREHGLDVCGGPLLRLDRARLPDWLGGDFEQLQFRAARHVASVVRRYQGQVQIWHAAARMNVSGAVPLSEEQKLRLAVTAIEAAVQADPETPILVSFDQPWGEYLAAVDADLSALDFADALVRADLGLAAVGLEINLGYWPGGTLPRDILEILRQIDRWAELGVPLVVSLTVPSGNGADPQAHSPAQPIPSTANEDLTADSQRAAVERLLSVLLANPRVNGLIWSQLTDARPHDFAHGGLFDAEDRPKPVAAALSALRRNHLA